MDDLSTISADLDAAFAEAQAQDQPADDGGTPHPDSPDWTVRPKAEAEPAPKSIEDEIASALDEQAAAGDDAEADKRWQREQRRLADDALRRAGIDPAARHQHQISRREATRRLYQAEALLRTDPARGLEYIAASYAPQDGGARAAVAQRTLAALGYSTPSAIAEQEHAELQQYRQQAQAHRQALEAAIPIARQQMEAFAAQHPDFPKLRGTMATLLQAGEVRTLQDAYASARRLRGMPPEGEAAAQAADEARRSKLASAKAAGTPRTSGAPARELPPDHSGKSTTQLLEEAFDAMTR